MARKSEGQIHICHGKSDSDYHGLRRCVCESEIIERKIKVRQDGVNDFELYQDSNMRIGRLQHKYGSNAL